MHKRTLKNRALNGARLFQVLFALVLLFSLLGVQPAAATHFEAPSAQGGTSTTFAIISDFGTGPGAGPTANMVHNWNPAFIITAGDNHQGWTISEGAYEQVVGAYYGATAGAGRNYVGDGKFWPVPGNHDYMVGINYYTDYFNYLPPSDSSTGSTNLYYDIVRGPVHFFMMNSEASNKTVQQSWLEPLLKASTSPWKIVVFHTPAASAGAHGSSSTMQWDFAGWGADFVIQAHNHIYERIEWNDIVYFTTGAGGNNGRSNYDIRFLPSGAVTKSYGVSSNANGATKVTATNTEITFEFFSTSDQVNPKDTYTQTRQGAETITITADDKVKAVGDPDPVLTYTITEGALADGDEIIGALTRKPGEEPGTYAITQGSLAINNGENYDLTFVPGTFTITPDEGFKYFIPLLYR